MKQELEHDYLIHSKHRKDAPVFHRIKFNKTSIFLTQTSYTTLTTGTSVQGHYRVFQWTDFRAKAFLGFELGQTSPALGDATLIGSFKPEGDDLTEVKYHSFAGKAYFESAIRELDSQRSSYPPIVTEAEDSPKEKQSSGAPKVQKKRIDASNFMKMKEIIPTGAQGKAIYGEGNYIIDGAAGTGKSTTVLQKIKLLQLHENITSERICIIVKNQQVVQSFKGLLGSLNILGVKLYSQSDFVSSYYGNGFKVTSTTLENTHAAVKQYIANFESGTNLNKLTSRQEGESRPLALLKGSNSFQNKLHSFFQACDQYCQFKAELKQSHDTLRKSHIEQLTEFQKRFEANLLSKKRKSEVRRHKENLPSKKRKSIVNRLKVIFSR